MCFTDYKATNLPILHIHLRSKVAIGPSPQAPRGGSKDIIWHPPCTGPHTLHHILDDLTGRDRDFPTGYVGFLRLQSLLTQRIFYRRVRWSTRTAELPAQLLKYPGPLLLDSLELRHAMLIPA